MSMRQHRLFIVSDRKLEMTGHNTLLLVITRCISCKFKNFSSQVFEHSGQIN